MRFFRRSRWDDEREREIEAYLAQETDDNIARGMTPVEARYAARRKLGNATLVREEIYRMNTIRVVDELWQDVRYGARLLRLNPGFALVAVLSLSLGIGANTAIFQLIDAVRLRALPVERPDEIALVRVANLDGARGSFNSWHPAVTNPIWERLRDADLPFAGLFAWGGQSFDVAERGPARISDGGLWVSGDYFRAIGVRPALGRLLTPDDDRRGCGPRAVLSHAYWQRERGGDLAIVGKTISFDRRRIEVIGVAEAGFSGLEVGRSFDVALPICAELALTGGNTVLNNGTIWWLTVMGRLKPGATIAAASARLAAISPGLFSVVPANYPPESAATYKAFTLMAEPAARGVSLLRDNYVSALWVLLAIAGVVLLIASANLANLMLARASAREREMAVRLAIGASRGRIVRQLLAESALLVAIGSALGAALAGTLSRALIGFLGNDAAPVALQLGIDWRVFAFTAATAIVCAALFGLAPAIRATRVPAGATLRTGSRGLTADRGRFAVRRALVVAQVALSLALVVCAFQFVATFRRLATLDTGFRQEGIVLAGVDYWRLALPAERRAAFRRDLLERVRAAPGVESAALVGVVPLSGASWSNAVWTDGGARDPNRTSNFNWVGTDYFRTFGIAMILGRDFDERLDRPGSPKVAIVNEAFARNFLGGGNSLGRGFWVERTPSAPQARFEVIGLVADTKYRTLRDEPPPIAYLPTLQQETVPQWAQIAVRTARADAAATAAIHAALTAAGSEVVVSLRVLTARIRETLRREQLMATLSGFFGALAAVLATVGLYGVMSYTVARRRSEIGVRLALGATRRDVVRLVAGDSAKLVAAGLAAGIALALGATTAASALLFGLKPYDPATMGLAVASLTAVAALASYLPAARAARLEPTEALREE